MQQVTEITGLARKEWKNACEFHAAEDAEVRRLVLQRVEHPQGSGRPTIVFDLDSTLYDVSHRTFYIVREWAHEAGKTAFPAVAKVVGQLSLDQVTYSIKDLFEALALDMRHAHVNEAWAHLKDFWWDRFFTSPYLLHDRPYEGAAEFARKLAAAGAHIIYMTGREDGRMRLGTETNLARDLFPVGSRTELWMKPRMSDDDFAYKQASAAKLSSLTIAASFENEPRNFVALYQALPDAMHVFLDTVCSDTPAQPLRGVYLLRRYV